MRVYKKTTRLKNGAVIGSRGTRSERVDGFLKEWPHQYEVHIGEDVFIGANATIQRGTWRHTTIGTGSQLGPQVNIGHNTDIGLNCWIAAGTNIAGSVTIMDEVTIWMGVNIAHGVTIGEGAEIGMGSVVLESVPDGELWAGNPAKFVRMSHETARV